MKPKNLNDFPITDQNYFKINHYVDFLLRTIGVAMICRKKF